MGVRRDDCITISVKREMDCHNGFRKQRYMLSGSGLGNYSFRDTVSHFLLHHYAEAVTAHEATRAVSTILYRSIGVTQGTFKRNSEDRIITKLSGRESGSKLIDSCVKCRII